MSVHPDIKAAYWRLARTVACAVPKVALLAWVVWIWFEWAVELTGHGLTVRRFGLLCGMGGWMLGGWFGGVVGYCVCEALPGLREAYGLYRESKRASYHDNYPGARPQLPRPKPPPRGQA